MKASRGGGGPWAGAGQHWKIQHRPQAAFAKASSVEAEKDAEIRRLKRELTRMTEERDLLKKGEPLSAIGPRTMASAYFARDAK